MKNIFTRNSDYTKTAILNWKTSPNKDILNIKALADGFLQSAIDLSKQCLVNNDKKQADILIFPILHNANHGIELYLKTIIWTLNKLLDEGKEYEGKHDIKQLLETTQKRIKSYTKDETLKEFNKQNKDLREYIIELYSFIEEKDMKGNKKKYIDFSRYTLTDDKTNHFYIDILGNVEIDIENFIYRFEKIKDALENSFSFFYDREYANKELIEFEKSIIDCGIDS